jgi:hypothetical protein
MLLENVIIETKDGARELINIDEQETEKALPSSQGVIVHGIQSLLKEGNQVIVRVLLRGSRTRRLSR